MSCQGFFQPLGGGGKDLVRRLKHKKRAPTWVSAASHPDNNVDPAFRGTSHFLLIEDEDV